MDEKLWRSIDASLERKFKMTVENLYGHRSYFCAALDKARNSKRVMMSIKHTAKQRKEDACVFKV